MAKFELTTQQEQKVVNKVDRLFKMLEEHNNFKYDIAVLCNDIVENPDEWKQSVILRAECEKQGIDLDDLESLSTKKAIFERIFEPFFDFTYYDFIIYSQVGKVIKQFNILHSEFNEIGYTKLRFLAPLRIKVSDEKFLNLLEKAKGMTVRELQKYISSFLPKSSKKEGDISLLPYEAKEEELEELEKSEVPKKKVRQVREKEEKEEIDEKDIKQLVEEDEEEVIFHEEPEYKYLTVSFKKDVYDEIVAEALRIAEELTGYMDNERKLLYIFMDFIALHQTSEERIQNLKKSVEQLIS